MPNEHLVLCGGARRSSAKRAWKNAQTTSLDLGTNVNLEITDISRALAANLSAIEIDLLEIASYVYVADQATTRGGLIKIDYGKDWHRSFRFEIPVREPDHWNSPQLNSILTSTLGFLSDDQYEFVFRKARKATAVDAYLDFRGCAKVAPDVDEVVLFSGGLDSLAGAVQEILVNRRRVSLVSHRPSSKLDSRQKALVGAIREKAVDHSLQPEHVTVRVNKSKSLNRDYTQRTRSFLYASIASIVAKIHGLNRFRFFENGVISLNLPLAGQVVGAQSTRTTHPRTLVWYEKLFTAALNTKMTVENPFLWRTKAEVIRLICGAGHADLCRQSVSCAHTWDATKIQPHCGRCSQCVDRRLAAIAAGLNDHQDDPRGYRENVLTGDITDAAERTLAERYVGTAHELAAMPDPTSFISRFPEAARALSHLNLPPDDAATQLFDLHKRHGRDIQKALGRAVKKYADDLAQRRLPSTCLLRIAVNEGTLAGLTSPNDEPELAVEEVGDSFHVDKEKLCVRQGSKTVFLGATMEFKIIERIARRPGTYIRTSQIIEDVWDGGVVGKSTVARHISNVRRKLKQAGLNKIKIDGNQDGHYALIIE
jgi:7-cyano-7-deazaguanine synthase in queuosine biosynthesis